MIRIITGDCRDVLPTLPAESVHCVVTSPPYFQLRDYGVDGQLGLEETPEEYVDHLVAIFRQVRRVLRDDACAWINLGDSYHEKQLQGIPWKVAFALQADGWWLRSDCIWEKPNCMPSSVTDRPTTSHEYVFLLSKSARYFWDADAVREDGSSYGRQGSLRGNNTGGKNESIDKRWHKAPADRYDVPGRNRRTVWTIPTRPFSEAHFAVFPPALVEPCIKSGTSERGCCPECGAAWERVVDRTSSQPGVTGGATPYLPDGGKRTLERGGGFGGGTSKTTGWQPTCTCFGHFEDVDDGEDWITEETGKRRTKRVYVPDDSQPDPIPCTVLDPFGGAGTVGLVADRLGRDAILIELSPDYAEMARQRIVGDAPMLVDVRMEQPPEMRSRETL